MRTLFFIPSKFKKPSFKQASSRLQWVIALCALLIGQSCSYDEVEESLEYQSATEIALTWNHLALDLERNTLGYRPPVGARMFAYVEMAAYEASLPGLHDYISMETSFDILDKILKPGGLVVICDFFKTEHHGDGGPGDGSFGGGHPMAEFYRKIKTTRFSILRDEDITARVSPNLQLVNDLLLNTIKPVGLTLNKYLAGNYPKLSWLAHKLLRKKLEKANYKYFAGNRTKETFERYKTYRLLVCQLAGD